MDHILCVTFCVSHCVGHIVWVTLCGSHCVCHIVCVTFCVSHLGKGPKVQCGSTVSSTVRLMAVPLAKNKPQIRINSFPYRPPIKVFLGIDIGNLPLLLSFVYDGRESPSEVDLGVKTLPCSLSCSSKSTNGAPAFTVLGMKIQTVIQKKIGRWEKREKSEKNQKFHKFGKN